MPQPFNKRLSIGLRYFTDKNKKISHDQLLYYIKYLHTLEPLNVYLVTVENDPVIDHIQNEVTKVITIKAQEKGFVTPVTKLFEAAQNTYLLMISVGVSLQKWQLLHGFEFLKSRNLLSVGWRILTQENDGSYVGRLSYNTCCLYQPDFYKQLKKCGGIPGYVENGTLGTIKISLDNQIKEIPIGGQEDLASQLKLYINFLGHRNKLYGHIAHYIVGYEATDGLGIDYETKLIRKMMVADVYCRAEDIDAPDFMHSWIVV